MKNLVFIFLISGLAFLISCNNDEVSTALEYHIKIESPAANTAVKVGNTLAIKVEFTEHEGGTVHHINVRIYNKATNAEVYNKPNEAHVHQSGSYTYEDNFTLNASAGDYILEATVWGHDDGVSELKSQVEFKVG